jgi:hypothetical protein
VLFCTTIHSNKFKNDGMGGVVFHPNYYGKMHMESMDVTGMMSGLAGVIGAIAALLTAIVAFKNAKSSKPTQQHPAQGHARPTAVQPTQFVQGVPNALQPKTQVTTFKLFARFAVSMVLAILLSTWFNSLYYYESPLGYLLAILSVAVFFLACVYAMRLLYRLMVSLFLR